MWQRQFLFPDFCLLKSYFYSVLFLLFLFHLCSKTTQDALAALCIHKNKLQWLSYDFLTWVNVFVYQNARSNLIFSKHLVFTAPSADQASYCLLHHHNEGPVSSTQNCRVYLQWGGGVWAPKDPPHLSGHPRTQRRCFQENKLAALEELWGPKHRFSFFIPHKHLNSAGYFFFVCDHDHLVSCRLLPV